MEQNLILTKPLHSESQQKVASKLSEIILGGQDRGYDFTELAERIKESAIQHIILFPGSRPRIREALEKEGVTVKMEEVESMEEAVEAAKSQVPSAKSQASSNTQSSKLKAHSFPLVLLSTASPSYGMFRNFEEKGEAFAQAIRG